MKIKHPFNLIEIALAIAIVAVGISSIMVLFPVGINATNDAVADNNIPDAAEFMLAYLEAGTQAGWKDANGEPIENNSFFADTNIKDSVTVPETPTELGDFGDEKFKWLEPSIFAFQQTSKVDGVDLVDFSAIIKVEKQPVKLYYELPDDAGPTMPMPPIPYKDAVSYRVELSYPAEKPYSARQKAIYWLDVYNQALKN